MVSKTGSRDFKGTGYDYVRNDALNANTFFNNRQGIPKGTYRYNTFWYNLGGPIFVPDRFNATRDRLFFFFSQEILRNQQPNGPRNYTVPTALERQGNFSQSYANALLGNFQDYTEATARANYAPVTRILEWYVQDAWRVASRLTLDLGVRFTAGLPQVPQGHFASAFVPSLYDPARAPALYRPGFDAQGRKMAIDPRCPAWAPQSPILVGFIVPGSGDPLNGIVKSGTPGYPDGLVDYQGILPAPRLGFAWDATGDHKTAVRGGFGVNYNPRAGSGILGDSTSNPPQVYNPQQFYGNTATFLQVGTFQAPSNVNLSLYRQSRMPKVYNTSIGIQREIGVGTTVDLAYVGSFGRNIGQKHDINQVPGGARFLPQNQDPTTGKPLSDNFLRPCQGYGSIQFLTFDGTARDNSLQTQVNHRLSHGVQFGVAYTWSRAYDYTEGDQGAVSTNPQLFNYGLAAYDRPHLLALNYSIELPKGSRIVDNAFVRSALDGWQLVGTTRFVSGAPLYWGWTGTNTAAFAPPAHGQGNAGPMVARGPGINTWNMSLFKNFKVADRLNMQFRARFVHTIRPARPPASVT